MRRAETQSSGRRAAGLGLLALALGQPALPTQAQSEAQPSLTLTLPAELRAGEHALLLLEVSLPDNAGEPLLLTPFHEGEAIEIVRGRLLRSDARDPAARPLRFELPVLAHSAGAAVVGVKLLAYLCRESPLARPRFERCRAVELETRRNVVVLPR